MICLWIICCSETDNVRLPTSSPLVLSRHTYRICRSWVISFRNISSSCSSSSGILATILNNKTVTWNIQPVLWFVCQFQTKQSMFTLPLATVKAKAGGYYTVVGLLVVACGWATGTGPYQGHTAAIQWYANFFDAAVAAHWWWIHWISNKTREDAWNTF